MAGWRAIPRAVWTLGFVSMFMDLSSEMIHALLPIFMVSTLGASAALLGVIEGMAEGATSVTKVFSGWLSDRLGHRKWLAVAGYGLAALTKPVFPLAQTWSAVLAARLADRVGKGLRGAPRDALVADITPSALRGAAYGVRQALDTVGAVAGPLAAMGLMLALADIRKVLGWAVAPAIICVLLLVFGVKEPERESSGPARTPIRLAEVAGMGRAFWAVLILGVIMTFARFSEAFLILRAIDVGLAAAQAPIVMAAMSLVYALIAAPAGRLSDRRPRWQVLAGGLVVLVLADLVIAGFRSPLGLIVGAGLWGAHMGLSQGLFSALIADTAPARLRGTGFGVFNLATGLAVIASSSLAGELWQHVGPSATFLAGAGFAGLAVLGLTGLRGRLDGRASP
ncbi:MFS transporter [Phenylobacterium montanum]|uniref:MFS transporter n=1 Tax=Phenylobacterium montanum TaxID=2823693 RepID=A0A975IX64_9CAUL|nr:MFS transporter [Caulobacter sp. S6]